VVLRTGFDILTKILLLVACIWAIQLHKYWHLIISNVLVNTILLKAVDRQSNDFLITAFAVHIICG
jgi:hypothetical protein